VVKVPRKGNTLPEAVLARVVEAVEHQNSRAYLGAIQTLLTRGPLTIRNAPPLSPDDGSALWGELQRFLRAVVRNGYAAEIGVYHSLTFAATRVGGRVVLEARAADTHDLVVLQLIALLQQVGLRHVRACRAPDCVRIYVKTYRREFCSVRCQKRTYMRQRRENDRLTRLRRRQRKGAA
jgi:hypothetical protein